MLTHVGLTQLNPNFDTFGIAGLPQYACPDLSNRGTSWVFPITSQSSPCGSAQKYTRRLRNHRKLNGSTFQLDEDKDEDDDDEDDSDSDYELKSTGL